MIPIQRNSNYDLVESDLRSDFVEPNLSTTMHVPMVFLSDHGKRQMQAEFVPGTWWLLVNYLAFCTMLR